MYPLRKVTWNDVISAPEWKTISEVKKWAEAQKKEPCKSIGWMVVSTKKYIVLAGDFDGDECYGSLKLIYKSLIDETKRNNRRHKTRKKRN